MIKTRVLFLFTILIQAASISPFYFGQSFSLITNVYATSDVDGGKEEGDDGGGKEEGDDGGGKEEGDDGGGKEEGDDGGGKEDNSAKNEGERETTENDQDDDGKEVVNDAQPEGISQDVEPESPQQDNRDCTAVPSGGYTCEESYFIPPSTTRQGNRDCTAVSITPFGTCPNGSIPSTGKVQNRTTTPLAGGPVSTFGRPTIDGKENNYTTLTIKKVLYDTKQLIPGSSYILTPNPFNPSPTSCLFVHDNDVKYDFNTTKGVVLLKNLPYLSYNIVETSYPVTCDKENASHEARISINKKLPHPVVNIVENTDLARQLPDGIIPFHYIIMVNDTALSQGDSNSDDDIDTKSIAEEFVAKGARLIHVYKYVFNGFSMYIPNNELLNQLMNDPRIAAIERDKLGHIASAPTSTLASPPATGTTAADQYNVPHQTIPAGLQRILSEENKSSLNYPNTKPGTTLGLDTTATAVTANALRPELTQLLDMSGMPRAHDLDVDVDIAIVDSGVSKSNQELNVYRDIAFVNNTISGDDDDGHGSHVAGTAAARDNSFGVVGVAPGARLWAVKVCYNDGDKNRCPISSQIKAMDYLMQYSDEIDVVNISLKNDRSNLLDKAVSKVVTEGRITVVVAAGNSERDAKYYSPAHNSDVITVSAIADSDGKCGGLGRMTIGGADDHFANFSNFGPAVDIAAPGVDIFSTYYKNEYALESGTSMATPYVTGYAALFKAINPLATPSEIKAALMQTAVISTTPCDGNNHGHFYGDVDDFKEPLLYINLRSHVIN
jgi:subtilisin family serine protease